ncbi:MAG: hypothetical protein ACI4KR_00465 [Ruminiclostridium sp.]
MEHKSGNKLVISMLCTAGALILLLVSAVSLGWFTNNKTVEGNSMGLTASDNVFELGAMDRAGYFDSYLSVNEGYTTSDIKDEDRNSITLTATGEGKPEIKWRMSENGNFGNLTDEGIQPGSSGKLTFYVIAKNDGDLKLTFNLDTVLYNKYAEENEDNTDCIIPKTEAVTELVKGHILFFRNYNAETGIYSEQITEEGFGFEQINAVINTAYKVEFYWVWPLFADQIILPENDSLLKAKGYERILENGASLITADNLSQFFAVSGNTSDITYEMVTNMMNGSASVGFDSDYYNLINAKWNEADQLIGTNVGYVELQLSADVAKADNS